MSEKTNIEGLRSLLKVAAIFFIVIGLLLALFPRFLFGLFQSAAPSPTVVARWLGVIITAYGLSVVIAGLRPAAHWLIWFTGFVASSAMALMTLAALLAGQIGGAAGVFVLLVSLLWAAVFGLLIGRLAEAPAGGASLEPLPDDLNLDLYRTQDGRSLADLSGQGPVLLVLLRHLGCTFCRETLADVAAQRHQIESAGAQIVFAHMGEDEKTKYLFERYRLEDIPRISDPDAKLYHALGLHRASFMQVYGPGMWRYAIQSILLDGHGMGQIVGDRFQMPGAFLIQNGAVVGGFRHQRISDHPDYLSIVRCVSTNTNEDISSY